MNLATEILEILFAITPACLALFLVWRTPKKISGWVLGVLGSSAIAIVALGFLLKRLTATCPLPAPTCVEPAVLMNRIPGIFGDCFKCSAEPTSNLALALNQFAEPLQATVAVICIVVSFVTTIRFVFWAKKALS
jgi:hypothetical protein